MICGGVLLQIIGEALMTPLRIPCYKGASLPCRQDFSIRPTQEPK